MPHVDVMLINDAARALHLLGLAIGFGVALIADASAARSLVRPLDIHELNTLRRYHRTVTLGLLLFWTSGAVLLWLRTGFDPALFTPKLQAKLGVVSLLTVNAILIGRIGLPTMVTYFGFRFGALPFSERLRLAWLGGLSGACWFSALALGVFSQMKEMSWDTLSQVIGAIYLVGFIAAFLTVILSPLLIFCLDRVRDMAWAR